MTSTLAALSADVAGDSAEEHSEVLTGRITNAAGRVLGGLVQEPDADLPGVAVLALTRLVAGRAPGGRP